MNRFPSRFLGPIDPLMAPPIGNVPFRPPQGGGALRMGGGGVSAETMGPGHPQQQQGSGLGMGDAMAAGGLLSKLGRIGGGGASAGSPVLGAGGIFGTAAGGPEGVLPQVSGLLGTATGGPEGLATLGMDTAGGNALALSNPASAALAAPGLLNMAGINVPNPVSWLTDLFGF